MSVLFLGRHARARYTNIFLFFARSNKLITLRTKIRIFQNSITPTQCTFFHFLFFSQYSRSQLLQTYASTKGFTFLQNPHCAITSNIQLSSKSKNNNARAVPRSVVNTPKPNTITKNIYISQPSPYIESHSPKVIKPLYSIQYEQKSSFAQLSQKEQTIAFACSGEIVSSVSNISDTSLTSRQFPQEISNPRW